MSTPVRLITPTFPPPDEVAADYAAIVASGVFSNGGSFEQRFSAALATWVGPAASVSLVTNATAALELALQAAVGASSNRHRVLVPSFTFAAGPLTVMRAGLEPLFVDVDPETWQPSLADARAALDRHADVAAILLTSTFGVANEAIAEWEDLAHAHSVPLVVDSAAGFGSRYPWGEPLGARGDCEVFSLHATKTLAVGEGGAIVSRNPDLIARVEQLKNFGFDSTRASVVLGTNAKLSELSCAIGLRQLGRLADRLRARQAILVRYRSRLEDLGVVFQPGADSAAIPFVSALLPTAAARDALVAALDAELVQCRIYYNPPVHHHDVFAQHRGQRALPATEDVAARIISLPMADDLADQAIDRVARAASGIALTTR